MDKKNYHAVLFSVLLMMGGVIHAAEDPPLNKRMNEEIIRVPTGSGMFNTELETTIFKPNGPGPFPVVIINHGKSEGKPAFDPRARFIALSEQFFQRGYAIVMPMRKGFSRSGGSYIGAGCNIASNGLAQAEDVQATLDYVLKQPWTDQNNILVMGQSHGGLTTMALGSLNPPHVKALVNFAGGLRNNDCNWVPAMVDAFSKYGKTTKLPSVWFYGANDSYFNPEVASRIYEAYTAAGGDAKLIAYGPFDNDSHKMSGSRDGVPIWWPETEALLKRVGLPTEIVAPFNEQDKIADSHFAPLNDVAAVPFVKDSGRKAYTTFLSKAEPRAFAISPSGAWAWVQGGIFLSERALEECQKNSAVPCRLYALNQKVVWTNDSEGK